MFKSAGWLLAGLVGSVLVRGVLWVGSAFAVGPLLGPVDLVLVPALGRRAGTVVWVGEAGLAVVLAVGTGVVCWGLGGDRGWAYRIGVGLARGYVAVNVVAAAGCVAPVLVGPLVLYTISGVAALIAARQLSVRRRSALVAGIVALRRGLTSSA